MAEKNEIFFEEVELVRRLKNEGLSDEKIVAQTGYTYRHIGRLLRESRAPLDIKLAKRLRDEGLSYPKIARQIEEYYPDEVMKALKKKYGDAVDNRRSPLDIESAKRLRDEGLTYPEIASQTDYSSGHVGRVPVLCRFDSHLSSHSFKSQRAFPT